MGIRVDPRTGMIVSGPSRPSKFPPSPGRHKPKKTNNAFPARPFPQGDIPQESYLSVTKLNEFAKLIGITIAEQLKSIQVIQQTITGPGGYSPPTQQPTRAQVEINIDESIIDVGIGMQDKLEKGIGSGKMAKETLQGEDLSGQKESLRALKGRKR